MISNKYLYGDADVSNIPQDIIDERVTALNVESKKLLDQHYLERDSERLNTILRAIDFWQGINKR